MDQPATPSLNAASGRNLHEKIADAIGSAIIGGAYPSGSALPTEMELCAQLAVSRSALREAFKLLSAKGLIQSRQKVGTLVCARSDWNMLDPDVLAWHLRVAPTDAFVAYLFEVREIVEPAAAALAAERSTPDMLERMEQAFADMVRFQDGLGNLADADLRFHQAILDATGNYFLASLGAVIRSALESSFRLSWNGGATTPEISLQRHQDVLTAIRERRGADARMIMSQLLRDAIADVRESLARRHRLEMAGNTDSPVPSASPA